MQVHYLSVIVAAIAVNVLGMLWYSPTLFGTAWMRLTGLTKQDREKEKSGMPKKMGISLVASFIMAWVFFHVVSAWLLYAKDVSPMIASLQTAFWLWLGLLATNMLGIVLWEGKSFKLYLINVSYQLVQLLLMGAIIGYWL